MKVQMFQTYATQMEMEQKIELLERLVEQMFPLLAQETEEKKEQWVALKETLKEAGY